MLLHPLLRRKLREIFNIEVLPWPSKKCFSMQDKTLASYYLCFVWQGGSCDDFSHSSHVLLLHSSLRVASSTGFDGKARPD
ncbi:hypothetical protein CFP56_006672 [Quercus suber]|uniref:Uncharacterized protein n=1 Tax=Quercus suber TaxID=58331 RepID=A0AAW0L9I0_QUESU